ncbi:MAG TPA: hypothetical protein VK153_03715 [Candidatus Paceibacterota bacterium]|nr:hypothetical protein [Candidatus Paceibacterota bacterium]
MKKFFGAICLLFLVALVNLAGFHTKSPPVVATNDMNGFAVTDMGVPTLAIASEDAVAVNTFDAYYAVNAQNLVAEASIKKMYAERYLDLNPMNKVYTATVNQGVIRPNLWPMTSFESSFNYQQIQAMKAITGNSNKINTTGSKERSIAIPPECKVNTRNRGMVMSVNMQNCENGKKVSSNFNFANQRC